MCLDQTRGRVLRRQRSSAGGGSVIGERRSNLQEFAGGQMQPEEPRYLRASFRGVKCVIVASDYKNPATVERPRRGN